MVNYTGCLLKVKPSMSSAEKPQCIVVVTVDAPTDVMPHLETHANYGLLRFPEL